MAAFGHGSGFFSPEGKAAERSVGADDGRWGPPLPRDTSLVHCIGRRQFSRDQANSSRITFPPLAIFIGRPLRLVNVVSSEMPSARQTDAITSSAE